MKYNILRLLFLFATLLMQLSCTKESEETGIDPLNGLTKLEDGYVLGASARAEIWGQKNFFVGYNKFTIVLYDSVNLKEKISDAHIYLVPVMTMGMGEITIQHACPIENPNEIAINEVFPGAIAFTMPTTMDGFWKLGVSVHNHKNNKEGKVEFDITVDNPETSVLSVFTSQSVDSSKLILSMLQPTAPKVGMNDIEFTIHKKADMMHFPADDTYSIEITPEMPSMGHGSPNNVNPKNTGNGHYKGKVNFTMTGEWKVNVLVKKDGVTVSKNANFIITF